MAAGVASGVEAAKAAKKAKDAANLTTAAGTTNLPKAPVKPTTPITASADDYGMVDASKAPVGTQYKAPNPQYIKPDPSHGIIESPSNPQYVSKTVKGDNILDNVWDWMKKGAERRDHI